MGAGASIEATESMVSRRTAERNAVLTSDLPCHSSFCFCPPGCVGESRSYGTALGCRNRIVHSNVSRPYAPRPLGWICPVRTRHCLVQPRPQGFYLAARWREGKALPSSIPCPSPRLRAATLKSPARVPILSPNVQSLVAGDTCCFSPYVASLEHSAGLPTCAAAICAQLTRG